MRTRKITRVSVFVLLTLIQVLTLGPTLACRSKHAMPQSNGSEAKKPQFVVAVEVLTDTEGVDFNSYLGAVYRSIRDKWLSGMPEPARMGRKGANTVQFRVLQDGTVPQDWLKLVKNSTMKDLDEASLKAIRNAAPFPHLPEKSSRPYLELRMNFYYNIPLPKPLG